jgi:predicted methyltransferase MtxX (methanogen marker protein 4)
MAEVEKARQVLEAERQAVLDGLRQVADDAQAEFERHRVAMDEIHSRSLDLVVRGKAAGATVVEMAEAANMTRQRAHAVLRQADPEGRK